MTFSRIASLIFTSALVIIFLLPIYIVLIVLLFTTDIEGKGHICIMLLILSSLAYPIFKIYKKILKNSDPNEVAGLNTYQDQGASMQSSDSKGVYLTFDIETTGMPISRTKLPEDLNNWPYVVEIAWQLLDKDGRCIDEDESIINQPIVMPRGMESIHGITTKRMRTEGFDPQSVYTSFLEAVDQCEYLVAHNIKFDLPVVECDLIRNGFGRRLEAKKRICTMTSGKRIANVYTRDGKIKSPKLSELYGRLYHNDPNYDLSKDYRLHSAGDDTRITTKCFLILKSEDQLIIEDSLFFAKIEVPESFVQAKPIIETDHIHYVETLESLEDKGILVTGTLDLYDRKEAEDIIVEKGGICKRSVTSKVDYVIIGAEPGWKKIDQIEALQNKGHHIMAVTQEVFYEFINE